MKKTLLALAVVASAVVSGSAMAETGAFTGTVTFAGTIDATDYSQNWEWKVGTGFDTYMNKASDVQTTADGKHTLTITNKGNNTVLLGATNKAFTAPVGYGAAPNIAFAGFDSKPITLTNTGMPQNSGNAFMDIPVQDVSTKSQIGTLRLKVTVAGVEMDTKEKTDTPKLHSLYSGTNTARIFKGGIPTDISGVEFSHSSNALQAIQKFKGASADQLFTQIQAATPGVQQYEQTDASSFCDMSSACGGGRAIAAAYAMGIADNDDIVITFNDAVTQSTQWSAPLTIALTYV